MTTITVERFQQLLAAAQPPDVPDVLDVRTPGEFAAVHIPGARLQPLDALDCGAVLAGRADRDLAAATPIYLVCHSGARAGQAAKKFAAAGFDRCVVVEGGTAAWVKAGFEVERGRSAVLPLPRQMQLLMGTIILTGVLLAWFVSPAWVWLAGFVGAGLVFAGLTDICPMRDVLARAPWNRAGGSAAAAGSPGKPCCLR